MAVPTTLSQRGGVVSLWGSESSASHVAELLASGLAEDSRVLQVEVSSSLGASREFLSRRLASMGRPGAKVEDPMLALVESLAPTRARIVTARPDTPEEIRNFLYNIGFARESYRWVLVIQPSGSSAYHASLAASSSLNLMLLDDDWSALLDGLDEFVPKSSSQPWSALLLPGIAQPRLPVLWRNRMEPWQDGTVLHSLENATGVSLAAWVEERVLRSRLLSEPTPTMAKLLPWLALPLAVILLLLPVLLPTVLDSVPGMRSDLMAEYRRSRQGSGLVYQFDGKEPLQRIARYAIGRYTFHVTNETMVAKYAKTIQDNASGQSWSTDKDGTVFPPAGLTVRFPIPDSSLVQRDESKAGVWRFLTEMVSDSVSYVTEWYGQTNGTLRRNHDGIDVGSRMGARILAPFDGKAWTAKDDRGGVIIALLSADGNDVMLFMHCDQLLYMDGQDVMEGDPIATVGMTGHTTGPHVHLAAGQVSKKGSRQVGPIRYNPEDPILTFQRRARRVQEEVPR